MATDGDTGVGLVRPQNWHPVWFLAAVGIRIGQREPRLRLLGLISVGSETLSMSGASWWVFKSHDANVRKSFVKPRLVDLGIFPFGLFSLEHGLTGLDPVAYCGDEWLGCLAAWQISVLSLCYSKI
jgi:hypothetical protein